MATIRKPRGLSAGASKLWDVAKADIEHRGMDIGQHAEALLIAVESRALWDMTLREVKKLKSTVIETASGHAMTHPSISNERNAKADYLKALKEIALTPAARLRLGVTENGGEISEHDKKFG